MENTNAAAVSNQQKYQNELNTILDDTFLELDGDEETKVWYNYAKQGLMFASPVSLSMPTEKYLEILKVYEGGIKYTDVAFLCNNLSLRTPHELGVTLEGYMDIMRINFNMVKYYNSIVLPIMSRLQAKYGLGQQSRILTLGKNGTRN